MIKTVTIKGKWPWEDNMPYQKRLYRHQRIDSNPLITLMKERGRVTVRQVSLATGISVPATRERLNRLVHHGLAKRLTKTRKNTTQPIFYGVVG